MKSDIKRLAKEAGLVEGPWANGNKERIWQENRDFPDALEVFASLIAKECIEIIEDEMRLEINAGTTKEMLEGLKQATVAIEDWFDLGNQSDK